MGATPKRKLLLTPPETTEPAARTLSAERVNVHLPIKKAFRISKIYVWEPAQHQTRAAEARAFALSLSRKSRFTQSRESLVCRKFSAVAADFDRRSISEEGL